MHPTMEIPGAMNDILAVAAKIWDEQPKTATTLPGGRHINQIITTIYCATFESGHGTIFAGDTYVATDTSASIYAKLVPMNKIFGVSGDLYGPDVTVDVGTMPQTREERGTEISKKLAKYVQNDFAAATDLEILHSTNNDPSKWRVEDSKRLAADISE